MRKVISTEQFQQAWDHYEDFDKLSYHGSAGVYPRGEAKVVRLSSWDSAYFDFAMCLYDGDYEYLRGNCFPEIFCIHYTDNGACIVVIERLEELCDLGYEGIDEFFSDHWKDSIYDYQEDLDVYMTEDELALITDEFKDAYDVMIQEAHERGWQPDIHGYNIMVRIVPPRNPKTGRFQKAKHELVIIDPWC